LASDKWQRDRLAHDIQETGRIAQLEARLTSARTLIGPMTALSLGAILIAVSWSAVAGFLAGVGLFIVELLGLIWAYEGFGRLEIWRARDQLARRPFPVSPPVYQPPASPPPRREQTSAPPPPRRPEPRSADCEPSKITSLRQAIEILGLPPKTTLSAAKAAYRTLMAQYHPQPAPALREPDGFWTQVKVFFGWKH
jgi:hypothetical protein